MTTEDFSSSALNRLLEALRSRDPALGAHVQQVIDAGQDVTETDTFLDRRRSPRNVRRTVALSAPQALDAAIAVLEDYFLELPLFINSALDDIAAVGIGVPETSVYGLPRYTEEGNSPDLVGEPKQVEIEIQTATRITPTDQETQALQRVSQQDLDSVRERINRLREAARIGNSFNDHAK